MEILHNNIDQVRAAQCIGLAKWTEDEAEDGEKSEKKK